MASPSRRDVVATTRSSIPSLAGIAARVATPGRSRAKARRWMGRALLLSPTLAIVASDALRRGHWLLHMGSYDLRAYLESLAMTGLLWASLVCIAARRKGGARWVAQGLLVVGALLAVGGQLYVFDRYQAYLNHRAVLVGTSMLPTVGQALWMDRVTFARAIVPVAILAALLPWLVRRLAPSRRTTATWSRDFTVLAALVMAFSWPGRTEDAAATPDVLYLAAMGQLGRA